MAVVISDQLLDRSDRLMDGEPDEHLVSLAQTGHEVAFEAIVRRYEPELLAQARRLSSDGRAEDAVQQALLNAFAALQAGAEVRHLRGWLHRILRNAVIRGHVPADAPLEAVSAHGESLEETVQRRAQARATLVQLSALPDRQRDALLGIAVMGFPRSQVAQRMGLSEGAVRQLVHRARLRLRQAATALVPVPLGRWFGAARSAGGGPGSDAVIGAGTAASGGFAIKVGTLVASGVVATGLAVGHALPGHHHQPRVARPAGAAAGHHAAPVRSVPRLAAAPALGSGERLSVSAASGGLAVAHRGEPGRHDGGRAGLRETEPGRGGGGAGRGHDDGHDSGARGQQESGRSGPGNDGGTRGSTGDDGGRPGSGSASGSSHSQSDSGSTSLRGASSGHDGAGDARSGSGAGGSADGSSSSLDGSGSSNVTGDRVSGSGSDGSGDGSGAGGSGGSAGSVGSVGSSGGSGGSGGSGSAIGSGSAAGSGSGSGADGGQKDSGGSRDVSGSQDSSSS
jgi:RNA polymerase sigma factor (sigma-70 family)